MVSAVWQHGGTLLLLPQVVLPNTDVNRWLFIVEGGITVLAALLSLFILPDYPAT